METTDTQSCIADPLGTGKNPLSNHSPDQQPVFQHCYGWSVYNSNSCVENLPLDGMVLGGRASERGLVHEGKALMDN